MLEHQSAEIGELAAALAKVQEELEGVERDSKNPFFKSKYADLHSVWQACRKPLSVNGLSVSQITISIEGKPHLVTMLMHKSGQWIKSCDPLILGKQDMQGFGAAKTYAKRYGLEGIVGISSYDDDGEENREQIKKEQKKKEEESKPKPIIGSIDDLKTLVSNAGYAHCMDSLEDFLNHLQGKYPGKTHQDLINQVLENPDQLKRFLHSMNKWSTPGIDQ